MSITWRSAGEFTDILYEKAEGIARITINRPEVHNAFRPATVDEMYDAFVDAHHDAEIGVVLLTGAGGRALLLGRRPERTRRRRLCRRRRRPAAERAAAPALYAHHAEAGDRAGGGLRDRRRHVLHVICDLTIAADNARFGQTGPKVGSFDAGLGSTQLARIVGHKKAREIWYLCRQYDAQEALAMGLVNAVVPLEQLEEEGGALGEGDPRAQPDGDPLPEGRLHRRYRWHRGAATAGR